MEINRVTLDAAGVGFNNAFNTGLETATSQHAIVAMTVPSTTKTTEYGWLAKMPRIREWLSDRIVHALEKDGYKITNKDYELTIGVDRNDFDDDNLGIYDPLFRDLGMQATTFPDELVWPLLKAGFSTECYDGQYFFDTDHPVLDENGNETSVSNTGGGAGTNWFLIDDRRPLKPIIFQERKPFGNRIVMLDKEDDQNVFMRKQFLYGLDGRANVGFGLWQTAYGSKQTLDATSYEAARTALMEMKGDYGKPLSIMPNKLIVPPSLEGSARKIVGNSLTTGGATNEWFGTAEVVVVPWLA